MALTDKDFWTIIDSTTKGIDVDRRKQVAAIANLLKKKSLDDLASFHRRLDRALVKSYTFPLMVAAFTVYSHIADDVFLDFRAWLILHGRKTFQEVLKNPDALTALLPKKDVDRINSGGLPDLVTRIWLDRGADLALYTKKAGFLTCPKIKTNWPKDKDEFQKRYPVLYAAYWNPSRIRSLHQ
jgi:hypothetical protein